MRRFLFIILLIESLLIPGGCTSPGIVHPEKVPVQPIPARKLLRKAEYFEKRILENHLSPEGLLIYKKAAHAPQKAPVPPRGQPAYGNLADGTIWTGCWVAAESLRYATTRDPSALAAAKRSLGALRLLHEITGKRGLLARHFSKDPGMDPASVYSGEWHRARRTYRDYIWRGDVSKDQYTGFLFGCGLAYLHLDDEARSTVRDLVRSVADHLLEHDLTIVDADGGRTRHGNLRGRICGVPIGVNALIDLAAFKLAAVSTRSKTYRRAYRRLLREGYPDITYWSKFQIFGKTNHNNDNMAFLMLYLLFRMERDPEVLDRLRKGMERTWCYIKDEQNALFNFIYLSAATPPVLCPPGAPCCAIRPPSAYPSHAARRISRRPSSCRKDLQALEDGIRSLALFPERKRCFAVDLRNRPGMERAFFTSRKGIPKAKQALPMNLRTVSSFMWKSCPYALYGKLGARGETEYSGEDYLLAYWMGRYHGFIPPPEWKP
jgi:hypothetical protein